MKQGERKEIKIQKNMGQIEINSKTVKLKLIMPKSIYLLQMGKRV